MIISGYGKIYTLGHKYVEDIFDGEYIYEEKIDGSQISFGVIDGELCIRSKEAQLNIQSPDSMFKEGVEYIKSIKEHLAKDVVYRGEYLKRPKHNVIAYQRIPRNHIIIFDIYANGYLLYRDKVMEASRIGLETVPKYDTKDIQELLTRESCLSGSLIEGVVIKNYTKSTPHSSIMCGKFVSEKFKERITKKVRIKIDIVEGIVNSLATEARFLKTIAHIRDKCELTNTLEDMPLLLKDLHQDIDAEEQDYIKEILYKYYIKDIKRGVVQKFKEWYMEEV